MSSETQLTDFTVERRQLTVMFCDMIGSTSLAYRLDPEDLRIVLHSYRETIADVVTRFEGSVIRYVGDGVLAYFCYPVAHEDDAERAVNAALEILSRIKALRVPLEGLESVQLQVRIGVATGMVVTGDSTGGGASEETLALGETPNLAARLQELAAPNTVTISVSTRALIGGLFELTSLGSKTLKGIPDPVPVWQVDAPADVTTRFAATIRSSRQSW